MDREKGLELLAKSRRNKSNRRLATRTGRIAVLSLVFLLIFACQARISTVKPRLEEDGQVFVYLESLGQEADRLTFRLDGISAVRGDGTAVPLALHVGAMSGKDPKGDRLMASGILPPGQYTGFSFLAKEATLRGEDGVAALPIAEEIPTTPVSFRIARQRAQVVSLRFRYRESLSGGVRFAPSFSAEIPGKLAIGLIGMVTSRRGNTAAVFDKMTGKVVAVIPTGTTPVGVVLDPVSRRAYVAISGDDSVEAIDLLEGEVINRGQLVTGDRPEELVLTPDRKFVLSANSGSDTVSVIDASSLVETRRIQVGSGPQSLLVDRAGRRAYVFNTLSGTISVLDLGTFEVTATISSEPGPVRGDFNRAGNRLYVLHWNSPYLSVFDPATLSVLRKIYVGSGGMALKVDPRTDLIRLSRRGTGEILTYDPFSLLPVDTFRIGQDASHLAIDGETNNLFVVVPGADEVRAIHLLGKTFASRIEVADAPAWVALMGER